MGAKGQGHEISGGGGGIKKLYEILINEIVRKTNFEGSWRRWK